ncbi:hypothetical protein [Ekhidna sp.]
MTDREEKSRNELKSYFQTGERPKHEHFSYLIEAFVHKKEDGIQVPENAESSMEFGRDVRVGSLDAPKNLELTGRIQTQDNLLTIGKMDDGSKEAFQLSVQGDLVAESLLIGDHHFTKDQLQIKGSVHIGKAEANGELNVFGQVNASQLIIGLSSDVVSEFNSAVVFHQQVELKSTDSTSLFIVDGEINAKNLVVTDVVRASKLEGELEWTNINGVQNISIPTGAIIMWSGSLDQIPHGWILCDGENGTPDLRDRFIVGAGESYEANATGGLNNVALKIEELPAHTHSISNSGNHRHSYSRGDKTGDGAKGSGGALDGHTTQDSEYAGAHSHTADKTGKNLPHENRPPYYALAFIMKIEENE